MKKLTKVQNAVISNLTKDCKESKLSESASFYGYCLGKLTGYLMALQSSGYDVTEPNAVLNLIVRKK